MRNDPDRFASLTPQWRGAGVASLLMYAALRWAASVARTVVATGRIQATALGDIGGQTLGRDAGGVVRA